jgi:hypothetical protein
MTPRYEWTPASEPPPLFFPVLVWIQTANGDSFWRAGHLDPNDNWVVYYQPIDDDAEVTHWRDVAPPNSDEGKGE